MSNAFHHYRQPGAQTSNTSSVTRRNRRPLQAGSSHLSAVMMEVAAEADRRRSSNRRHCVQFQPSAQTNNVSATMISNQHSTTIAENKSNNTSSSSSQQANALALESLVELQTCMFRRPLPITSDLQTTMMTRSRTTRNNKNKPPPAPAQHTTSSSSSINSGSTTTASSRKSRLKRLLSFKKPSSQSNTANCYNCNESNSSSGANDSWKRSIFEKEPGGGGGTLAKVKSAPSLPAFCLDSTGSTRCTTDSLSATSDLVSMMIQSSDHNYHGALRRSYHGKNMDAIDIEKLVSNQNSMKLLHLCKRHPSMRDVASLLKKYPDSIKARSTIGQTPLHVAAATAASAEVILYILEQDQSAVSVEDDSGKYPIHYAARQSRWKSAHAGLFLLDDPFDHHYDHSDDMFYSKCSRWGEEHVEPDGITGGDANQDKQSGLCALSHDRSTQKEEDHYSLLDPMYKLMIKTLAKLYPEGIHHEDRDGCNAIEYAVLDDASMDVIKLMQRTCIKTLRRQQSLTNSQASSGSSLGKSDNDNTSSRPLTTVSTSPRSTLTFSARNEVAGRSA